MNFNHITYHKASSAKILSLLLPMAMIFAMGSCKPTEKNYRKAYETTMEARRQAKEATDPGAGYIEVAQPMKGEKLVASSSGKAFKVIPIRMLPAYKIEDYSPIPESYKRYNVVVASFRQKFNAASMYNRWKDGGYPGTIIWYDPSNDTYVVVCGSYANLDEALEAAAAVQDKGAAIGMQSDCPMIYDRGR